MPVTEQDARRVLIKYGPISCANMGAELWQGGRGAGLPPINHRRYGNCSCPFARPAGKLIARLVRLGHARPARAKDRRLYEITSAGERAFFAENTRKE